MLSYVVEARDLRRALDGLAPAAFQGGGFDAGLVRVVSRGGHLDLSAAGDRVAARTVCHVAEACGEGSLDVILSLGEARAAIRDAAGDDVLRLLLDGEGGVLLVRGDGRPVPLDWRMGSLPGGPAAGGPVLRARATSGRLALALDRVMPAAADAGPDDLYPCDPDDPDDPGDPGDPIPDARRVVVLLPRPGALALVGSDARWVLRDWLGLADGPDTGGGQLFLDLEDAAAFRAALRSRPPAETAELRLALGGEGIRPALLAVTPGLVLKAPLGTPADHPRDARRPFMPGLAGGFLDWHDARDLTGDDGILWFCLPAGEVRAGLAKIWPVISEEHDRVLLDLDAHGRLTLGRRARDPGQARHEVPDAGCRPGRPVKGCLPFHWLDHMARMAGRHPRLYCALDDRHGLWMAPGDDWPGDVARMFHAMMFLGHEAYG
jgi:hypothetical protein